ncbi:MAG: STAS domain-containing protein [Armatimonadetes bacterium]|nr:STAS domain-containing protein [Armatimonadota bacterium]
MSTDDLVIEKQTIGDIGIVKADGIVDLATMRPMREAVRDLLSDGVRHMILDLRDVAYMDSAGISIIMTAKRGVADHRGEVYVAAKAGEVSRALHLVQMDRVVKFVEDPNEALSKLRSTANV